MLVLSHSSSRFEVQTVVTQPARPASTTATGIPLASFTVQDVRTESERLTGLGVRFTPRATEMGPGRTAVFDLRRPHPIERRRQAAAWARITRGLTQARRRRYR